MGGGRPNHPRPCRTRPQVRLRPARGAGGASRSRGRVDRGPRIPAQEQGAAGPGASATAASCRRTPGTAGAATRRRSRPRTEGSEWCRPAVSLAAPSAELGVEEAAPEKSANSRVAHSVRSCATGPDALIPARPLDYALSFYKSAGAPNAPASEPLAPRRRPLARVKMKPTPVKPPPKTHHREAVRSEVPPGPWIASKRWRSSSPTEPN